MKSVAQGDMGKPNDQVKPGSTLASVFPPMTKSNQVKIGGLYYPQKKRQHTLKFECVGFLGLQQNVLKSGRQAKRLAKSLLWTSTRFWGLLGPSSVIGHETPCYDYPKSRNRSALAGWECPCMVDYKGLIHIRVFIEGSSKSFSHDFRLYRHHLHFLVS